ncbi:MAG TPA: amidohydrolase family protein [Candidatus Limnocylindrales bacterium]|nr:amidohydrolase family protein [Candidatus Limnocylindrales bacterium]
MTLDHADVLIRGARIVDGTGAPARNGDLAIVDGRIREIRPGDEAPAGVGRTIDATNRVVAPGFIDLHSHSALMILADPDHGAKVRQGVTTELVGVDGLSYAPFPNPRDLEWMVHMNAGLDGDPRDADGAAGTAGRGQPVQIDWQTVQDVLLRYDTGTAVNVAQLVGNTPLRIAALGWEPREATPVAMRDQRARLREALEEGAFGVSSGLDYPPGAYATTAELAELANEAAKLDGIYHTHVRYALGDRFLDPFREAIEIGRRGEAPAHITHFYHRATFPGTPDEMLELVDDATAEGLDVSFDLYPSEWASTRLLILIPIDILAGGPLAAKERLADPAVRARIRDDLRARGQLFAGQGGLRDIIIGYLRRPANRRWEGRTLGELIDDSGKEPVDALCDLLLEEDLRPNEVTPGPNLPGTRRFLRHPGAMIGTDSVFVGARPSPRTFGSYPRILGQFVRDEALLGLEDAIARMTSMPARRLGLRDRGVIRDGAVADLVIFDPATVRSDATIDDPARDPVGIDTVVVAGRIVVDQGRPTGERPGRGLRRGRD